MNTLIPRTIEEWTAKKRQFMRLLNQTDDPRMAQDYENAINFCDRGATGIHKREALQKRIEQIKAKIRHKVKCMVIAVSIAVILAILLFAGSGCAHTINGVGQDLVVWSSPYIHQEK